MRVGGGQEPSKAQRKPREDHLASYARGETIRHPYKNAFSVSYNIQHMNSHNKQNSSLVSRSSNV